MYNEKQQLSRLDFYKNKLARSFLRGIILVISYTTENISEIHTLCIPCLEMLQRLDFTKYIHLVETKLGTTKFPDNLLTMERGTNIELKVSNFLDVKHASDMSPRQIRPKYFADQHYVCALLVLQQKFNLTLSVLGGNDNSSTGILFFASPRIPITNLNNNFHKQGVFQFLSYNVKRMYFTYTGFQTRPILGAQLLTKPYTWKIWLSYILSMLAVVMINLLISREKFDPDKSIGYVIYLVSISLEQSSNFQPVKGSRVISFCWL